MKSADLNAFRNKRVVIIGDLVADQFLRGTISRVSREAPVFILRHDETDVRAGGAANAAANVAALSGSVDLIGLVGNDIDGDGLIGSIENAGVSTSLIVRSNDFRTTTKVRVLAGQQYAARQQVIRIDYENKRSIGRDVSELLLENLKTAGAKADAVVVSDYDYGVVTQDLFSAAKEIAAERSIPIIVDSRFRLAEFKGATSATPNQDEAEQLLGKDVSSEDYGPLLKDLGHRSLLVTRGNKGVTLYRHDSPPLSLPPIGPTEPVDVTGAGDTVIAAYSLGLAAGFDFATAAEIANHAGGIVVMKQGTATVTLDELKRSIEENTPTTELGTATS